MNIEIRQHRDTCRRESFQYPGSDACDQSTGNNAFQQELHLEEDVGGVEVAVADALAVRVRHAGCEAAQRHAHAQPPPRRPRPRENTLLQRPPQAPAVAELLHAAAHVGVYVWKSTCAGMLTQLALMHVVACRPRASHRGSLGTHVAT